MTETEFYFTDIIYDPKIKITSPLPQFGQEKRNKIKKMQIKKHIWLWVTLALALGLRLFNLTSISLWHDEAFSALLVKYSWGEMMYRIGLDVHPPMYYVFLRVWHYAFGDSLFALRAMSVFFGVLTVWAVYAFVKEAFQSQKAALWSALLCAVSPFFVQYVTEARMYTMGAFFAVLAAYFLVKALHHHTRLYDGEKKLMPHLPEMLLEKKYMLWNFVGFTASMIVLIYTHYYLLFTAAALGLYGLWFYARHHIKGFGRFKYLLLSFLSIGIAFLPWLKVFLFQYKQVGAGYWIPPMDRWSVPSTLWTLVLGFANDVGNETTQKILIVSTIVILFIIFRFLQKTQVFAKWLVLFLVLAPFGGAILFWALAKLRGSSSSVYLVRYFIFTAPFLSVVLGVWLSQFKNKILSYCLLTVLVLANMVSIYNYWHDLKVKSRGGMAEAAKYLSANVEPNQALYVGSSFEFFNLKYYVAQNKIASKPLLYSGGRSVKDMLHFEGTAILKDEDLVRDFKKETKTGQTVWLVWTNGFGGRKPETPNSWEITTQKEFPDVRPYVGTNIYVTEYQVR